MNRRDGFAVRLRALTALVEDYIQFLALTWKISTIYRPCRASNTPFWASAGIRHAGTNMQANIHTLKNVKNSMTPAGENVGKRKLSTLLVEVYTSTDTIEISCRLLKSRAVK